MNYLLGTGLTLFPYAANFFIGNDVEESMKWYGTLKFPWYTPPNYVFGPVWAYMYGSMGYASYCVVRDASEGQLLIPLALYSTQLFMNWIWSPLFFTKRQIKLVSYFTVYNLICQAAVELIATNAMVAVTTFAFKDVSSTAYKLMLPYLIWCSFASILNVHIAILN